MLQLCLTRTTLGQYKNCRIPAYGPISPNLFMQFVLENFYNTYYLKSYSLQKIKVQCSNMQTIKENERRKIHFNIF